MSALVRHPLTGTYLGEFTCAECGESGPGAAVTMMGELAVCIYCVCEITRDASTATTKAGAMTPFLPSHEAAIAATFADLGIER